MNNEIDHATRLFVEGRVHEAFSYVERSVESGHNLLDWVRFALTFRDAGQTSEAKTILAVIISKCRVFSPAYYELAFLHRLEGGHRQAAALLNVAVDHDPAPFRSRLFLAHMLHANGAHREADAVLAVTRTANEAQRLEINTMFAFGRYLECNPLGRSLTLYDRLLTKHIYLNNDQLADEIAEAVAQRRPFALVRLGDGEGGVLRVNGKDEAEYSSLYDINRQELIAMWFGHSFPWRTNGFLELASDLIEALDDCDVIGIPYEAWIRHEYKISSMRGIPSLMNIVHALLARQTPPFRFTSQLAHIDLLKSNKLAHIIASARKISIVSCIDTLPAALKAKFDLEEVTYYRIPGEQGSRHILGEQTVQGMHYPERYEQLRCELSHQHNGRLFLIAGGLLGKLYAIIIRRFGGVAIDIGSVVDSWAGYATRPGYTKDDAIL